MMQYRRVGRSGLQVSVLGLGLGNFDESGEIDCDALFERAVRAGVNFFDNADVYGRGSAERTLGRLIEGTKRSRWVIATKVCSPMSDDCNDRGLSSKHLRESIEDSLERLRTRYVDLYLCHDVDDQTPIEETLWTLDQLIREGKCLYWGVSNWPLFRIEQARQLCIDRGWRPPIVDESQYNLLNKATVDPHIDRLAEAGLGFFAWGPLASGVLTGKYLGDRAAPGRINTERFAFLKNVLLTDESDRVVSELLARSRDGDATPGQLAIAALVGNAKLSAVILGASTVEQLDENLLALRELEA